MPVTAPLFTPGQLATIQSDKPDYRAAVAVVRSKDGRYLLGLGKNTGDDRTGMWCHPGGHVDNCYDSTLDTARRECLEETGVLCTPVAQLPGDPGIPDVAFVYCETGDSSIPNCENGEHADTGMFTVADMRKGLGAPVYHNVRKIIGQAEKYRRQHGVTASEGNPNHDSSGRFAREDFTLKTIGYNNAADTANVHIIKNPTKDDIRKLCRETFKSAAGIYEARYLIDERGIAYAWPSFEVTHGMVGDALDVDALSSDAKTGFVAIEDGKLIGSPMVVLRG